MPRDYDFDRDEYERDIEDDEVRETKCRDCHSADVYWAEDRNGKWVLYDFSSKRHQCKAEHLTASRTDAFENMD